MPKWKKDAKEFIVSINHNKSRGYQSSIPKPIIEALGDPNKLKFTINGKDIKISSAEKNSKKIINVTKG
jgi:hypothetical protein